MKDVRSKVNRGDGRCLFAFFPQAAFGQVLGAEGGNGIQLWPGYSKLWRNFGAPLMFHWIRFVPHHLPPFLQISHQPHFFFLSDIFPSVQGTQAPFFLCVFLPWALVFHMDQLAQLSVSITTLGSLNGCGEYPLCLESHHWQTVGVISVSEMT